MISLAFGLSGCFLPAEPAAPRTVTLYAHSILDEAFAGEIVPAFKELWRERTGENVEVIAAFAGSGLVTSTIVKEVDAEVAIVASEMDAGRVRERGGLLASGWKNFPYGGVLCSSPMVLLVRPGNPHAIRGFEDLSTEGIGILMPDPLSSGAGEWTVLAAYGASLRAGSSAGESRRRIEAMRRNVVARAPSAAEARRMFESGIGDVTVTYEADLDVDMDVEIVRPAMSIVARPIVLRISRNVEHEKQEVVEALLEFLWSHEAQAILRRHGFGAPDELAYRGGGRDSSSSRLFTLEDIGGPMTARSEVLEMWHAELGARSGR
jgi:sulfate transport system substrate-binding protein